MTSRGCPARCTFCANYVTGRKLRLRAVDNVVAELDAYHRRYGSTHFQIWDDAFTADRKRTHALCQAFRRDLAFPLTWSATTRVNLVDPLLLRAMQEAGLGTVIFGVESGDDAILRAIGKGIRTDDVVRALEWAREAGLMTVCDFMLGFPEDTPASLERTLRFMERIAPLVDSFSALGVVIPLPGTPLYEQHHADYGFTDWWLGETHIGYGRLPPILNRAAFAAAYCDDAALAHDFFRYSAEERELMRACLKFKGEHNLARMGLGAPL